MGTWRSNQDMWHFHRLLSRIEKGKVLTKSSFTWFKTSFLIDQPIKPGYWEIQEACIKMDSAIESAMDVMTRLSKFFGKYNETAQE